MVNDAEGKTVPNNSRMSSLLESVRKKLLETGTRNRLIHVDRTAKRSNSLNIVNEQSRDVFAVLRVGDRRMRFRALGRDKSQEDDDAPLLLIETVPDSFDKSRYTDHLLETALGPDALQKRLLRLASDARTLEQEQGINILYLALGFLTWFEDKSSEVKREAPLILLPVELIRNERSSTFDLKCREDDIATNLPLKERLLQDFGITLPDIDETEDWSPSAYFEQVAEAVKGKAKWVIETDALQLGFFSFAKLLMLRDLDPANWSEGALTDNELIRGLLVDAFETDEPLFGPDDRLDELLAPADIIQVVDADASQTKVIEEVRRGSNLIVQGPPGTGKSQTITNIIAAAVHDGKTVLFMAEKMAALSVVHNRLVHSRLRDICIELHSRNANKKALAQELSRSLAAGHRIPAVAPTPDRLRQVRDHLNELEGVLHGSLEGVDYTPFMAIAEITKLIGLQSPAPTLKLDGVERLSQVNRKRVSENIAKFVRAVETSGPESEHPFKGVQALDLQPTDLQRLSNELETAIEALDEVQSAGVLFAAAVGGIPPKALGNFDEFIPDLALLGKAPADAEDYVSTLFDRCRDERFLRGLNSGVDWKRTRDTLSDVFVASAWNAPVEHLLAPLANGKTQLFTRLGQKYQGAVAELRDLMKHDVVSKQALVLGDSVRVVGEYMPGELSTQRSEVQLSNWSRELEKPLTKSEEYAGELADTFAILGIDDPKDTDTVMALKGVLQLLAEEPEGAAEYATAFFEGLSDDNLAEGLTAGHDWAQTKSRLGASFNDDAWESNVDHLREDFARGKASFLARLGGAYKRSSVELALLLRGELPKSASERLTLVEALRDTHRKRARLSEYQTGLEAILKNRWRGERTDFEKALKAAVWIDAIKSKGLFGSAENLLRARNEIKDPGRLATMVEEYLQSGSDGTGRTEVRHWAIQCLLYTQSKRQTLERDEAVLKDTLAANWHGEETDFGAVLKVVDWLTEVRERGVIEAPEILANALRTVTAPLVVVEQTSELVKRSEEVVQQVVSRASFDMEAVGLSVSVKDAPIDALRSRFASMLKEIARYGEWAQLGNCIKNVERDGLTDLLKAVREGSIDLQRAETEFNYTCAEARWKYALSVRPGLSELASLDRHELVEIFHELERTRIKDVQALILSRHFDQLPRGSVGEMAIIRGEIARKRGHKPIRWMMRNAGSMLQRIKPVFLMSPISIAQFLPPGSIDFDLLVIDEASQIRPEDALGAIARARQIVVVGDQKQLPPTSFFDRLTDNINPDEEEDDEAEVQGATATDMESILTLCEARGLRQRMLEWHYRSRDPSLIRVSNAEFYQDSLVLPPSPLQLDENYGLKFQRVNGVYSSKSKGSGRVGTNKIEAQAVVAAMAKHAREWPDLSLGVATFSKSQSDMVTELLEHARRLDTVLDAFLREGQVEDVFVKNIENVQGDERDVILISVGYGPNEPGGRLASMNFGPVNGEGGERRLNVLFSRARMRCEVFASFEPGDIDPARTMRQGPRVLKRFLEFAKSGQIEEHAPTGLDADSPFEEDVAGVIRELGFDADLQVGSAGFRIDLGVRHADRPGQYLVAVECDGATYHSALWARERDRLRQDVLEGLGWRFHRIWSTDWFYRRQQEIARLQAALENARKAAQEGIRVHGANEGSGRAVEPYMDSPQRVSDALPIAINSNRIAAPAYQKAAIEVHSSLEPHEAPITQLAKLVGQIVEIEGPIHAEEVARRVSSSFGKTRTGNRIFDATLTALKFAQKQADSGIRRDGTYWFTDKQSDEPPVRDRSNETGALLKASTISPLEIRAAAALISKESGSIGPEDMVRAVARLLGFQRVGSDLQLAIHGALYA